jgi:hypothetical protein
MSNRLVARQQAELVGRARARCQNPARLAGACLGGQPLCAVPSKRTMCGLQVQVATCA